MTAFDPESLRDEALEALGPEGDPRARDFLHRGTLEIVPSDLHWAGTTGDMRTHRVMLGLDGRSLATVRIYPAVEDALCGALSKAIGKIPGEALHELTVYWGIAEREEPVDYRSSARVVVPYAKRENEGEELTMMIALRSYLRARGNNRAASRLEKATLTFRRIAYGVEVTLHASPNDVSMMTQEEDLAVERGLEDLAAGASRRKVRVVRTAS